MHYFDSGNRLSMDDCAKGVRDYENQSLVNYNTYNFYTEHTSSNINALVSQYPNLRYHLGYGLTDGTNIDSDSKTRINRYLRETSNQQLSTRLFKDVPNLGRGCLEPITESMLIQGQDTSPFKDCHAIAEVPYATPVPFTPCMMQYINNAANAIHEHPIGKPSKDIFLHQRGRYKEHINRNCK